MQPSNLRSEMSQSTESSEADTLSAFGDLSELGDFAVPYHLNSWLRTTGRKGEYVAGESPSQRAKQYFNTVNNIITRLQQSGFRIEVIEPQFVSHDTLGLSDETDFAFCGAWASEDEWIDEFTTTEIFLDEESDADDWLHMR